MQPSTVASRSGLQQQQSHGTRQTATQTSAGATGEQRHAVATPHGNSIDTAATTRITELKMVSEEWIMKSLSDVLAVPLLTWNA